MTTIRTLRLPNGKIAVEEIEVDVIEAPSPVPEPDPLDEIRLALAELAELIIGGEVNG